MLNSVGDVAPVHTDSDWAGKAVRTLATEPTGSMVAGATRIARALSKAAGEDVDSASYTLLQSTQSPLAPRPGAVYAQHMTRQALMAVCAATLLSACAVARVEFPNATPGQPLAVPAFEYRPSGGSTFPALILLHGCEGVTDSDHAWARFFLDEGYVALIVDSWAARRITDGCSAAAPDVPSTERFDDAVGALHFLHGQPYVDRARVGVIGWSHGGVFAMAVINGPSLERARRRGVEVPEPGVRAAVGVYPGGCFSLVDELVVRPLLVLIGSADDWTVPGPCVQMVERMRQKGADASIVLYPGAYHYFDVVGQPRAYLPDVGNRNKPNECCGATVGYDAAAFRDARRRVAEFFAHHLMGR